MKATREGSEFSILIADDDKNCRQALQEIVEPEGYRTMLASSGEEALDIVQAGPVHLLLLDMHMPTLSGLETLNIIRQWHSSVPAILVTGNPTQAVLQQALMAHVYSVIPKPVSKHLVLYTVVKALSRFYGHP